MPTPDRKALDWSDEEWEAMASDFSAEVVEETKQALRRHGGTEAARFGAAIETDPQAE